VVALDPTTLGRRAWDAAIEQLSGSGEALVAIGPVDVVALATPLLRAATATRDPGEVRAALAHIAVNVVPLDRFYAGRARAVRELQKTHSGGPLQILRELKADEERTLRDSLDRLDAALLACGRPLVAVWAAQGDPDTAGFVRSESPEGLSPALAMPFTDTPLGMLSSLEATGQRWATDGVTVVAWSRPGEALLEAAAADVRLPLRGHPRDSLGPQPLTLFETVAETTGGALAQNQAQLGAALATAGGRFELIYQTSNAAAGWRLLRVDAARPGWTVRYPPRILVSASGPEEPVVARQPIVLAVELSPMRIPSDQPGRETVRLPVLVDLMPLRDRLGLAAPARFAFRLFATPPHGATMSRAVEVKLPALPAEGKLHYEATLVVPTGTSGYAVEVSESTTGAVGAAGPVDVPPAAGVAAEAAPPPVAPLPPVASSVFTDSAEVRIGEARFMAPAGFAPETETVRAVWKNRDQRVVRVAGGAGSSLELGIAIDVSESVSPERKAFALAAVEAVRRLLGPADRVFRVDFGSVPRYLGAERGSPGALFAAMSPGLPEKTAIFDALRFALDRFEGRGDRAALIVFTDGCETAGRTGWADANRAARTRAIPVFVVLADGQPCLWLKPVPGTGIDAVSPVYMRQAFVTTISPFSRFQLDSLVKGTGGLAFSLKKVEQAGDVWSQIEAALDRLFVAVFEPSDPRLDPREVEVRAAGGKVLRPGR
jgi:hypothetical protein